MDITDTTCPICTMDDLLLADDQLECVTCGHEWMAPAAEGVDAVPPVHDANGTLLVEGDTVVIAKELKVKGRGSMVLKLGTKISNIRLIDGDENIDCKVNGTALLLKGAYVKKA
jgi:protein PhnA